jgi:Dolichyl-phosphate-mannose-protein mannosyltransferase
MTATGRAPLTPPAPTRSFAASQRAGLAAMISLADADAPPIQKSPRLSTNGERGKRESPGTRKSRLLSHLPGVLPLIAIVTVQAALSARLISRYTVFNDEALYLWAGRVEWQHWLHGTPVPPFQAYFSGAPTVYPPLGALADTLGGLQGARILSLCFMLAATVLLWSTTARLYGKQAASFAAGFWAILGPTQHLGAYATYDAMALFLVALAAWCATGRRDKEDATGWIICAAGALALANAAKYASAIFDPVVIALAIASAWPHPGGKVALRRGTLLIVCSTGALALILRLGGPLYVRGLAQTTLTRTTDTTPIMTVLGQSWAWVGSVAVIAALALVLSWRRPGMGLTALLVGAVLLVPIEQARIHTTTSLNKHVDFGAWFAAIAAGYAIHRVATLPRPRLLRAGVVCACVVALFAVSQVGEIQARNMLYGFWPNETKLIAALEPLTARGGKFLAEGQYVPLYYLRKTSWQDWSNTRSVRTPNGDIISVSVGQEGDPKVYKDLIAAHYFSVVMLTFTDTVALDNDIARDLRATSGYHIADIVPFGSTINGNYTIWVYDPRFRYGSR